jgi:hypothetical protein
MEGTKMINTDRNMKSGACRPPSIPGPVRGRLFLLTTVLLALMCWNGPAAAEWGPPEIAVQGILTNLAGDPVKGPVGLTFSLYDGPAGLQPLWTEQHTGVKLNNGRFDLLLGSKKPLDEPPLFEQFDDLWVGISVGGGAELPRAPLSAVGYAMQARHAEYCEELATAPGELVCTGCIGTEELQDGGVMPVDLAGAGCGAGQVLKRNPQNNAWVCGDAAAYTPGYAIKFNGLEIAVDKAALEAAFVAEDEENAISMEMLQPMCIVDSKIKDVSWTKLTGVPPGFSDGKDDGILVENDPTIGPLEAGKWCSTDGVSVMCTNDLPLTFESDPEVGDNKKNYVSKWDGKALVGGSIFDDGDVKIEGALTVDGKLTVNDNKIEKLAAPTAGADAANKTYVDNTVGSAIAGIPTGTAKKVIYTVVLALRADTFCPAGYAVENFDQIQGPNGQLHININSNGLFMGGMNGIGYGDHYLYSMIPSGRGITRICWKTYVSTAGWPHVSMFSYSGGDQKSCPTGYTYLPRTEAAGTNNNHAYMMSDDAGLYIGYVESWAHSTHPHEDKSSHLWRDWTTEVDTLCYRVYGVDEDQSSKDGVFPVFLGLNSEAACPQGWNVKQTSVLDGSNGYNYIQFNDNATVVGGIGGWGHAGNNHMQVHFTYSRAPYVCWKYFTRTDSIPYYLIRTPHQGACPIGYTSFEGSSLKGVDDATGRIASIGHALYLGPIHSWDMHDYSYGFLQHSFSAEVSNKLCLKLENVK